MVGSDSAGETYFSHFEKEFNEKGIAAPFVGYASTGAKVFDKTKEFLKDGAMKATDVVFKPIDWIQDGGIGRSVRKIVRKFRK